MRNLKRRIDVYFGLEDDLESQLLYYGALGSMASTMLFGMIANIFS